MSTQWKHLTPNIMVENVRETVTFYTEILGFELVVSVPEQGEVLNWAQLKRDNVELMFQSRPSLAEELPLFQDKPIDAALTFFIEISHLESFHASIQNQVKVIKQPFTTFYGMRECVIEDPNGFILTLAEPVGA